MVEHPAPLKLANFLRQLPDVINVLEAEGSAGGRLLLELGEGPSVG
jgi:hypothetical protein